MRLVPGSMVQARRGQVTCLWVDDGERLLSVGKVSSDHVMLVLSFKIRTSGSGYFYVLVDNRLGLVYELNVEVLS